MIQQKFVSKLRSHAHKVRTPSVAQACALCFVKDASVPQQLLRPRPLMKWPGAPRHLHTVSFLLGSTGRTGQEQAERRPPDCSSDARLSSRPAGRLCVSARASRLGPAGGPQMDVVSKRLTDASILHPSRFWTFVVQARGTHLRLVGCGKHSHSHASRLGPAGGPQMDVVRFETSANSVAEALCQRAGDLDAAALVMASHNKNALQVPRLPAPLPQAPPHGCVQHTRTWCLGRLTQTFHHRTGLTWRS